MKFARCLSFVFALLALPMQASARESVAIIDHLDVPVTTGTGKPMTADQVRTAISAAALSRKWEIAKSPSQEVITATLHVRGKHTAVVTIPYSTEKFSVKYQNSINLNYGIADASPAPAPASSIAHVLSSSSQGGQPVIHPFYNRWVQDLLQAIRTELGKL